MSRPLTRDDYLLIGGVLFVIISCLLLLARAYFMIEHADRRKRLRKELPAGEDLGQVYGPNRRSQAGERSLNLH